jgi:hypothetical protein
LSQLNLENILNILKEFTIQKNISLEIIFVGGLALHYYGKKDRATVDIDAEIKGNVDELINFLKEKNIPSDIGENISSWSVVSMPSGYRERAISIYNDNLLQAKVLHPVDFIIAKLRRFTEEDLEDAIFVAKKFNVSSDDIRKAAEDAIKNSPKDTALLIFKKNVEFFVKRLE